MFSCTRFADLQQFIWTRLYSLLKNLQKFTRFTRACPVATKFELNLKQYPVSVNIMLICLGRAIKILNRTSENYKLGWLWWYFFKSSMMICFGYTLTVAVRSSVFLWIGSTGVWPPWFREFTKACQQAQNYDGELWLHKNSNFKLL